MYFNGQILKHKVTNELAGLDPESEANSTFAWTIGHNTKFIKEDGTKFTDDIKNYTHIQDELGRPAFGSFDKLKQYLVSYPEFMEMREKKLFRWEQEILTRMKDGNDRCDIAGTMVHCPFADGSASFLFEEFFLKRRNAKPLFKTKEKKREYMAFLHTDGQIWVYNFMLSQLEVICDIEYFK